ncbi:TPA: hypothetical protein ACT9K3_003073 [Legionella pneumophila]
MIGNPNWFKRRAYTGWGITPKTWQGWAYIAVITLLIIIITLATLFMGIQKKYQLIIMASLLLPVIIDFIDIALNIKLDEREALHEAIAERNVAWFITFILAGGIVYQAINSALNNSLYVDPFMIIALTGATAVKGLSFWYLSDK